MAVLRQVVGETLRALRLRQRRTLREVSSAARVSLGYLSEVERGQKEPSSELLAAICDALGLTLADLLTEGQRRLLPTVDLLRLARTDIATGGPVGPVDPGLAGRAVVSLLAA